MTDKISYQETLGSIPDIASGKGRAFIYIPKGGPDIISTLGVIDFISVDESIYRVGGESYFYLDMNAGSHHVTTTEVVKKAGFTNKKQYGKNTIDITVPEGNVTYLRMTAYQARAYNVDEVSKLTAEAEMKGLPLWTNSSTTMTIK